MSKEKMKILLAMDADDGLAEDFRKVLEEKGVAVEAIEVRPTKRLVRQYVQSNPDVGAVILSEHIGEDSFSAREVDEISVAAPDALVIPIVDEEPGSRFMAELAFLGVYNAIYDEDGNDEMAAELIAGGKGRDKMSARIYYGIQGMERAADETAAFDTRNAIDYLRRSEADVRELRRKLLTLEKKLEPDQLKQVLLDVPDSVFETAKQIPEYRVVCDMVAPERNIPAARQEPSRLDEKKEPARARKKGKKQKAAKEGKKEGFLPFGKGKKKDKSGEIDPIRLAGEEHTGLVDIGFISTNVGVGCTTAAIMCAASLAAGKAGKKVAVIELDAADHNFEELYQQVTSHDANVSGATCFSYGAVDYYFKLRYDEFCDTYRERYDVVVYDFGSIGDELIATFMPDMEITYVVSSPKMWKLGELEDFQRAMMQAAPEVGKKFIYLFPSIGTQEVAGAAEVIGNNLVVPLPYDSNPFHPSGKTQRIFKGIFEGKYKQQNLGKKLSPVQLLKKAGQSADGTLKALFLLVSVAAVCAIFAGVHGTDLQEKRYNALYQAADKEIKAREQDISDLNAKIGAMESSLAAEEAQAVVILETVYPGDLLTDKNTEVRTVRSTEDASLYLSPDKVGKVAACVDMAPGTVVYERQAAVPISSSLGTEAPAESGADGESAAGGEPAAEESGAESEAGN